MAACATRSSACSTRRSRRWARACCASGCCSRCATPRGSASVRMPSGSSSRRPRRARSSARCCAGSGTSSASPAAPRSASPTPATSSPCAVAWRRSTECARSAPRSRRPWSRGREPPLTLSDGGVIRETWNEALHAIVSDAAEARRWIAGLEERERAKTGLSSLRVRFNRVFGYGIEVSHAQSGRVPADYVRRQTLTGTERYVTPELKDYEGKVLGAEERRRRLEQELFEDVRGRVAARSAPLLATARALALLDVLAALAEVAHVRDHVRPEVDGGDALEIVEGRHPVLEARSGEPVTPNDIALNAETRIVILTGPNMAGKSVYLRQTGLIAILAQMGAWVPARSARIGVVDRVFTRVGAQDNLARGQSTFLVEMVEAASILNNVTPRSLVLLDE